ncbi:Uncharacterized conserved protein, DUF697 family [Ectothiorhodospira magna]|uniref:Uncharacterized conserved protein, DUF697 family n=1 Tax=Ectothiorhodospira magna TaxID=867345 RepID=A0A1H8Z247_9GAMM|nr:DUF697 domain-containing protein [Ectothiorhodospira magna]SEP58436.1 Uncharacterized conserved protein, DUF697 family [Ectothiorhodospira magna]
MILWRRLTDAVLRPDPAPDLEQDIAAGARAQAPVLWLLGKVQSGKTSIVRAITGDPAALVGNAFEPCTPSARRYDFPPDVPVVRFLDTRGLEEVNYDPATDLAEVEGHAHGVIAVARAMDPQQDALLNALTQIRRRHPDWAVILVQTRLHDAYPDDRDHPPWGRWRHDPALMDLNRALKTQAECFARLPGDGLFQAIPVDFTLPEEGFSNQDYGLPELLEALDAACIQGRTGLLADLARQGRDSRQARIHPHIMGYATAAGVCDLVPIMGVVTVPALQGKMLHSIARVYALPWDRRTLKTFLASLGTGTTLGIGAGFAARQLGKLIPVYGQVAGAAAAGVASGAVTYALGRAACHYLEQRRQGIDTPEGVAETFRGALKQAYVLFRASGQAEAAGQSQAESRP